MTSRSASPQSSPLEVFLVALRLGCTSFGGPVAHLGYFRREYVERRRWLDEETFADIVGLCQFLPGPASSETGISIGLLRAGPLGAIAAWLGFTLPSAVLMTAFALLVDRLPFEAGWIFPILQAVALVVVANAVWRMAHALAWDLRRGTIAIVAALAALRFASVEPLAQVWIIAGAALVGWLALPAPATATATTHRVPIGRSVALASLVVFLVLLIALPLARATTGDGSVALFDAFYRSGALVFGGGHVVLPLLRAEVVPTGWLSDARFYAGYGAAQLVPGPLFTFAAYLGAVVDPVGTRGPLLGGPLPLSGVPPNGIVGAAMATVAIFLPGLLLVFAALPSWGALRERAWARKALRGVNAAVVGLLLAALVGLANAVLASLV